MTEDPSSAVAAGASSTVRVSPAWPYTAAMAFQASSRLTASTMPPEVSRSVEELQLDAADVGVAVGRHHQVVLVDVEVRVVAAHQLAVAERHRVDAVDVDVETVFLATPRDR